MSAAGAGRTLAAALTSCLLAVASPLGLADDAAFEAFDHPATAAELREGPLAAALAEVANSRMLEGKFTQRRTMRGLARPLESSGEFLLVRDLGLRWHTLAPVDDEFVLTRKGIAARDRDGKPASRRRQPPLGAATELLFALFSLDLDTLERRFDLYGGGDTTGWTIGLRPRDKATARAVREAVVHGDTRVKSIALVNGAGDELLIGFSDVSVRAGELSDAQRSIFE